MDRAAEGPLSVHPVGQTIRPQVRQIAARPQVPSSCALPPIFFDALLHPFDAFPLPYAVFLLPSPFAPFPSQREERLPLSERSSALLDQAAKELVEVSKAFQVLF